MNTKVFYSLKEYQSKYENSLEAFLSDYIDNTEEDFVNEQLAFYFICLGNVMFTEVWKSNDDISWSEFHIVAEVETYNVVEEIAEKIFITKREENSLYDNYDPNVNIELCKQYERSFSKTIIFLRDKKSEIENPSNFNSQISMNEIKTLKWQGTELEFTELIKSLIHSNKLNPEFSQKEIFARLRLFFNVNKFDENQKLKDIRKRTNTSTPFINILETSLNNWIKSKD